MYNYKLQIQYDGGRYDGWQRLGKDSSSNTIEVKIKDLIKKFSDLINNNGKVESVEERGTQKLAYPIKKKEEGY